MATHGNLSTKQRNALTALLTAKDVLSAARQAGVGERTLHRWLTEDMDFQDALRAAEAEALNVAVRRLAGAADSAVTTLMYVMLHQQNPASVRLRAALGVLDQLVKLKELTDMEQRLIRLEEQVGGRNI